MYNPATGRFLQRDPIGYPDGMNAYAAYHMLRGGVDPSGTEVTAVTKYFSRVKDWWHAEHRRRYGSDGIWDYEVAFHKVTLRADTSDCSIDESSSESSGEDDGSCCTGNIALELTVETTGSAPSGLSGLYASMPRAGIYHPATEEFFGVTHGPGEFDRSKLFEYTFTATAPIDTIPCQRKEQSGQLLFMLRPEGPVTTMRITNGYIIDFSFENNDCGANVDLDVSAILLAPGELTDRKLMELEGPDDEHRLPSGRDFFQNLEE